MIRWVRDEAGVERATADVLPSLRLHRVAYIAAAENYDAITPSQRPRLAGIFEGQFDASLPSVDGNDLHLFLSLPDQLGSSTTVLEHASGEVAERVTYTAYGTTEQDFRPTRWGAHREPLRFTGKEDDIEIGLTYFGARYYAPNLRQWASADPLTIHAMGADPNPYAYVAGRVTTQVDPFGLTPEDGFDEVYIKGPPREGRTPRDVQYNDREGQAEHRTGMLQWARGAGAELVRWNNEWQRNLNWVSLGVLESMPLSPVPGVPTLSQAINAARIGQSPGANKARLVGQLIGLGVSMAAGNELSALERSSATLASRAARGAVGGGSGPWVPSAVRPGGAVEQTLPGSCGAACVEMLSDGGKTQAAAIGEIGEWATPGQVAGSLGAGWKGGFFGSGADALTAAARGRMGGVLWAPGARTGHMVVIEPAPGGFLVRDPLPGVNYTVGPGWIQQWVAGGVFR